jgi:hypothetical protein
MDGKERAKVRDPRGSVKPTIRSGTASKRRLGWSPSQLKTDVATRCRRSGKRRHDAKAGRAGSVVGTPTPVETFSSPAFGVIITFVRPDLPADRVLRADGVEERNLPTIRDVPTSPRNASRREAARGSSPASWATRFAPRPRFRRAWRGGGLASGSSVGGDTVPRRHVPPARRSVTSPIARPELRLCRP